MGSGFYKFVILKNCPETLHYELLDKKKGLLDSIAEAFGLGGEDKRK